MKKRGHKGLKKGSDKEGEKGSQKRVKRRVKRGEKKEQKWVNRVKGKRGKRVKGFFSKKK